MLELLANCELSGRYAPHSYIPHMQMDMVLFSDYCKHTIVSHAQIQGDILHSHYTIDP